MRLLPLILLFSFKFLFAVDFEIQWRHPQPQSDLPWDKLKTLGISKIILPVFNTDEKSGGLFFSNTHANVLRPLFEERLKRAAENNLQLWAWMITRNMFFLKKKDFCDAALFSGEVQPIPKLDLASDQALKMLEMIFTELAKTKVPGILLQDDLVYRMREGFSPSALKKFSDYFGARIIPEKFPDLPGVIQQNWQRFKQNLILDALQRIIQASRAANSAVKIALNIYYESPLWSEKSEKWYAQNFKELVQQEIDFFYLMTYHRQMQQELKIPEWKVQELFREVVDRAYETAAERLVVKMQMRDFDTKERIPAQELLPYLLLLPQGVKKVVFISVEEDDLDELYQLKKLYLKATVKD